MDWLGPYHPAIVHAPIALLIVSAALALIGAALDRDWLRKGARLLFVLGVLGLLAGYFSGDAAGEKAEHDQHVPEQAVDEHEAAALWTLWLGIATLAVMVAAPRIRPATGALSMLAMLLQLLTAAAVGVTGYRGGHLVFEHGAGVKVEGKLLRHASGADSSGGAEHEHRGGRKWRRTSS